MRTVSVAALCVVSNFKMKNKILIVLAILGLVMAGLAYETNVDLYHELDEIDPEAANHCADLDFGGASRETVRDCFKNYLPE